MRLSARRFFLLPIAVFLAAPLLGAPSAAQGVGLPATVVDYQAQRIPAEWAAYDANGRKAGSQKWNVVANTGNCCENYVTASPRGRLFDMGGTFIRYTDNHGKTWKEVRSISRTINGEGALSVAPGGDIVAATWDPYSGDHLIAFKYDAETEEWTHQEAVLKTPFFDRPWFSVIPGPFTFGTIEAPYITILKGGWPSKDVAYISFDGLNYFQPTQRDTAASVGDAVSRWLKVKRSHWNDWTQPNTSTGIVPLQGIGALWTASDRFDLGLQGTEGAAIMAAPDATWSRFELPKGKFANGRYLTDSRGRLHRFSPNENDDGIARSFDYAISGDGGRKWTSVTIDLPARHYIENYDFRANARLDTTAIAIHAHRNEKKEADEADQDLVYDLDISGNRPQVRKLYFVGDGDANFGAGLGSNLRFDFATIAILPDGTIVTSFVDRLHTSPALAFLVR